MLVRAVHVIEEVMIKLMDQIDPHSFRTACPQAAIQKDGTIKIADDDYYETGGHCYSVVQVTIEDLEALIKEIKQRSGGMADAQG